MYQTQVCSYLTCFDGSEDGSVPSKRQVRTKPVSDVHEITNIYVAFKQHIYIYIYLKMILFPINFKIPR